MRYKKAEYDFTRGFLIYQDMSNEEIAEMKKMEEEMSPPEPTPEERISALENTSDDIILLMAELIGGN